MALRPWALGLLLLLLLLGLAQATQAGHALPRKLAAAAPASVPPGTTASDGTNNSTSNATSNNSSSSRPSSLVKAAWSITDPQPRSTNGSSAAAGWYPSEAVVSAMRQQMAAQWTLSPGQLRLTALSKLVIGYHFAGVKGWNEDASAALEHAASEAAGGFDPANISADTRPPDLGLPGDVFAASEAPAVQVRDAHTGDPLPGSAADGPPPGRHRRSLQQAPAGSSTSSRPGGGGDEGETALQQGEGDIYVTYNNIPPGKTDQLLGQLQASCGGLPLAPGTNLTATPCGQATRRHLEAAGLKPQPGYCQLVDTAPLVSLDVTLTLGLSEQQAAAGVPKAIAAWLSQPGHIQAALRSAGAQQDLGDAMVQWVTTPEILVINVQPPPPPVKPGYTTPAFVAGVAIGGTVAVSTAIIAILLLRRRYKRQIEAVKSEASDSSATSGNNRQRRRRRREGKRRYLLPDPPAPSTLGPSASAVTAGAGAGSNSAGDGAAAADEAGVAGDDDADLPLRPRLRELGDSVTSAVRFEQDDDEEEEEENEQAAAGMDSAAAAAAAAAGPGRQRQRQRSLQQQQSASCFSVPEEAPGSDPPAAAAPGLAAAAVAGGAAAALAAAAGASARHASAAEAPLQPDCSQAPGAAGLPWQQQLLQLPDLPSSSRAAAGHKPSPFFNYNFSQLLDQQPPAAAAAGDLECQQQQQQDLRSSRAPSQKEQQHDGLLPLSSSLLQGVSSMRIAVSSDGGVQPLSSPRCSQQQLSGWGGSNCCQRLSSSIALSSGWDGSGMQAAVDENGDTASSSTCSSSDRSSRGQRPGGSSRLLLGLNDAAAAAASQPAAAAKGASPSSLAVGGTAAEAGFARLHDLA